MMQPCRVRLTLNTLVQRSIAFKYANQQPIFPQEQAVLVPALALQCFLNPDHSIYSLSHRCTDREGYLHRRPNALVRLLIFSQKGRIRLDTPCGRLSADRPGRCFVDLTVTLNVKQMRLDWQGFAVVKDLSALNVCRAHARFNTRVDIARERDRADATAVANAIVEVGQTSP